MRKISAAILICLLLCGCADSQVQLQDRLNAALSQEEAYEAHQPSYNKKYYAYYIEPSVGRLDASATANLFSYGASRFVMNLNIPSVMQGSLAELSGLDQLLAEAHGTYIDVSGQEQPFRAAVYEKGNKAVTILQSAYMDFCGIGWLSDAPSLAAMMLRIARTVRVDDEEIIADYSRRDLITYEATTIQLFDYVAPESGSIEELFIDSSHLGDYAGIDFIDPNAPAEEPDPDIKEDSKPEEETEEK